MPSPQPRSTRRLELVLRKPLFALYGWIKPTVTINGHGQPSQWGTGTWQVRADAPTEVSVYLFNRLWRFGRARYQLSPDQPVTLEYTAPFLPFRGGRMRPSAKRPS